ncbi:hypothetical protein ACP70R_034269 [Stipagrostis hirtigluma subsp. patula]
MDAKKKSPPAPAAAGAVPPPANGYFSTVFSAPPAGNAKDAKQGDLYAMLNKQSSNGSGIADGKSQGHAAYKDGKHVYPNESSESPYFGSSLHYGGREFYGSSQHMQTNEPPRNYKEDNPDGSLATRGDWWQGSLYY